MIPFAVGAALVQAMATAPVPFAVGESFEYGAYYSPIAILGSVGNVSMTVSTIDTVRGVPSWHFTMTSNISAPFYKARSRLESWTSVKDFVGRRFIHFVNEQGKQYADEDIQIHADSGYYRNRSDTVVTGVPRDALDDLAFIYHIRTLDFKESGTYNMPRYFRPGHNAVQVTVLGHDTLDMPDGSRRRCWVVHLRMEDGGMFAESSHAKVWFSDDGVRIPVQIQSDVKTIGGHVSLKLKKILHAQ
jgi:hypothetical protein